MYNKWSYYSASGTMFHECLCAPVNCHAMFLTLSDLIIIIIIKPALYFGKESERWWQTSNEKYTVNKVVVNKSVLLFQSNKVKCAPAGIIFLSQKANSGLKHNIPKLRQGSNVVYCYLLRSDTHIFLHVLRFDGLVWRVCWIERPKGKAAKKAEEQGQRKHPQGNDWH